MVRDIISLTYYSLDSWHDNDILHTSRYNWWFLFCHPQKNHISPLVWCYPFSIYHSPLPLHLTCTWQIPLIVFSRNLSCRDFSHSAFQVSCSFSGYRSTASETLRNILVPGSVESLDRSLRPPMEDHRLAATCDSSTYPFVLSMSGGHLHHPKPVDGHDEGKSRTCKFLNS